VIEQQTNFINKEWLPKGYKPFSKKLYDMYNYLENIVIEKINIKNHSLTKNKDRYGIDIVIKKEENVVGGIEVESHGKYWKSIIFPFNTVHFLGRKKKFIGDNNYYLMLNESCTNCVVIPTKKLNDEFLTLQNNEKCNNEYIYDVPKNKCIFGWDNINLFLNNEINGDMKK